GEEPELRGLLLISRGLTRQALGDPDAMQDAVSGREAWKQGRPGWVAPALAGIATAFESSDPDAAEAFWAAAEQLADRIESGRAAALIAGERGRRALLLGELEPAAAQLRRCERLAREAGDDATAATALIGLARVDVAAGHTGEAARRIAEALALELDEEQSRAARWLLLDVGGAAAEAGLTADAELSLQQALERAAPEETELRSRALAGLAGLARLRGDADLALELGGQVAEILRSQEDETGLAQLVHDLGVLASEAGGSVDATVHLTEALALGRRLRLPALAASAARMLATIASLRGDHLRALGFAEEAASFEVGGAEREASAATLAAIGADAERWERSDVAIAAYTGALELYRMLDDDAAVRRCEEALLRVRSDHGGRHGEVDAALEVARRLTNRGA
ncbi:MAG: hypothetical protein JOZ92_09235, partial [Candidatus Dormibacteraeota bacterium]|nr:hypothetical protein [Candidatus Dormibacteraeota bacterium]